MTKLPPARAPSSEAFLAEAGADLAALCTACGACFAACPMVDVIGLRGADPAMVTKGLALLSTGETGPPETIRWAGACAKSGLCIAACPEHDKGLDAMLPVRIARQRAIATGQLKAKYDPVAFPRVKTFARLQLTDEELKSWL